MLVTALRRQLSVSSGLYLTMSQTESLQTVSLIVSPHAFLFRLAQLRMARQMERHPKERRALIVCGLCELGLGVALVWGSRLPSNRVAELLGGVAVLTILQLIPSSSIARSRGKRNWKRAETSVFTRSVRGIPTAQATKLYLIKATTTGAYFFSNSSFVRSSSRAAARSC
jgi:hypothetical protein